ncbi:MAG: hypothetical protein K5637_00090 [Lachnospiraceae bacterium]|nr:hypothetical protein [Lachnospiraceae bacterium]
MPERCSFGRGLIHTAACFAAGIVLGIISKWLDNLALDGEIWWHRWIEAVDLGNFFSDIAVWLLLALIIAAFSSSALRAAINVFIFLGGMCIAYHVYSIVFSGFNPSSYMMIWYGITLFSPILAVLCWYAKGTGIISILLDIGILAVFFLACFSIGIFYIDLKGILYLLVFCGAAAVLYKDFRQFMISLAIGIFLAFLMNPIWPYH